MQAAHNPSLPSWDIYTARRTPAKLLGIIEAQDADLAIVEAMKEFEISDPERLVAVRRASRVGPDPCGVGWGDKVGAVARSGGGRAIPSLRLLKLRE